MISEWLANGRHLPQADNRQKTLTVDALCNAYLDHANVYYKKNGKPTDEIYKIISTCRLLHEHCGMLPATEFTRQSLLAIQEKAAQTDWKRVTVNIRISAVPDPGIRHLFQKNS